VVTPNPAAGQLPWDTVYKHYAGVAKVVTDVLSDNPALYVLTSLSEEAPDDPGRGGEPGRLNFGQQRITGFEKLSPTEARRKAGLAMVEVWNNARQSLGKVMGNKVNPLQFDSLVARHRKGELGPRYATPFGKWAIGHTVEEAESSFDKTMETLGLGSARAGGPLIGAILAAANVGSAAAGAAFKTFEAQDLKTLSESSASPEGEVVSQEKAGAPSSTRSSTSSRCWWRSGPRPRGRCSRRAGVPRASWPTSTPCRRPSRPARWCGRWRPTRSARSPCARA
jgi:hypothetical protein